MNDIEQSHLFVYVEHVQRLRNGMTGALLHTGAGGRYLRVLLRRGLPLDRRIVSLAHELQHAREVVQAGIAADAAEIEALFRRIGERKLPEGVQQQYETAQALRVSVIVAADLRASHHTGGTGSCRAAHGHRVIDHVLLPIF